MKCNTCKHKHFHPAGSFYSVAECGDDPYEYEYCDKQGWNGSPIVEEEQEDMEDPWINCEFYEKAEGA